MSLKKDNLSHEQLFNCGAIIQNPSLMNSVFLEGKSIVCSNSNKECLSVPACCQKPRWPYNENYFVLRGAGGGRYFLPLKTELHQKLLFDVIVTQVRGCTQTFSRTWF